jgi:hypothetical protein
MIHVIVKMKGEETYQPVRSFIMTEPAIGYVDGLMRDKDVVAIDIRRD